MSDDGLDTEVLHQVDLDGRPTNEGRIRPSTMLWCDECGEALLRSERFDHEHDLGDEVMAYEKAQVQKLEEKVPEHAIRETQTWIVDFHYTCVERVKVEADSKHDAKEAAERARTYDGEYMETVHTDRRTVGEPSPASIEWLEDRGLLPDDHDVTQEDIDQLVESQGGSHV